MSFGKEKFTWRIYITNKILSITKQVQIINKKNFVITLLNGNSKTYLMYVAIQE